MFRTAFFALALICTSVAYAQRHPTPGEIWRSLEEPRKLAFVEGFILGHQAGAKRQQFDQVRAECGETPGLEQTEKLDDFLSCAARERPTRSHMRASDARLIVEGLNAIYSDVANSRIDFDFAISLMQDRLLGKADDDYFHGMLRLERAESAKRQ